MGFSVQSRHLGDILVIAPNVYRDDRGFFTETYRSDQFAELGLPVQFVQDNHSYSRRGVVRGLHFQWDPPMGKLMRVTRGSAFLVAADIRKGSPTLGNWFGMEVSAHTFTQIWAPAGFARGFCALSEEVEVQYKCTGIYNGRAESAIRWDDPQLSIDWPLNEVQLSDKDRSAQTLAHWLATPTSEFLRYEAQATFAD